MIMAIEPLHNVGEEQVSTPERLVLLKNPIGFNHGHYYQPPRYLAISYEGQTQEIFDITGTENKDITREYQMGFNEKLARLTLAPISTPYTDLRGVEHAAPLSNSMYSLNIFGVYADWIRHNMPSDKPGGWEAIKKAVVESGQFPVGDPYLHLILPTLSHDTQRMLQRMGNHVYKELWGQSPTFTWMPELACDMGTLTALREEGIHGVVVRRSQLRSLTPEGKNAPAFIIQTAAGPIMAVVGDDDLSREVSFDHPQADLFVPHGQAKGGEYQGKNYGRVALSDGERFGEHWKKEDGAFDFLVWRDIHLQSLVNAGILTRDIDFSKMPEATLAGEYTSWSCADGIDRWTGQCYCDLESLAQNEKEFVRAEKQDLFGKMQKALTMTEAMLDAVSTEDKTGVKQWRNEFIAWFDGQRENLAKGLPLTTEGSNLSPLYQKWFLVEATLLIGSTSCGWFFGPVDSYERQLPRNTLAAVSSLVSQQFVRDVPLEQRNEFMTNWQSIAPTNRIQLKQRFGVPLTESEAQHIPATRRS